MPEIVNGKEGLVPQLNVGLPEKAGEDKSLVSDEQLLGIYSDILGDIKKDRAEIDDVLSNFADMVLNGGDSSGSSKEALVNLIKLKVDQTDKATKIADLMTRVKLKDKDTFPRYLAQNNSITISDNGGSKRALLDAINKAKKEKGQEGAA